MHNRMARCAFGQRLGIHARSLIPLCNGLAGYILGQSTGCPALQQAGQLNIGIDCSAVQQADPLYIGIAATSLTSPATQGLQARKTILRNRLAGVISCRIEFRLSVCARGPFNSDWLCIGISPVTYQDSCPTRLPNRSQPVLNAEV